MDAAEKAFTRAENALKSARDDAKSADNALMRADNALKSTRDDVTSAKVAEDNILASLEEIHDITNYWKGLFNTQAKKNVKGLLAIYPTKNNLKNDINSEHRLGNDGQRMTCDCG